MDVAVDHPDDADDSDENDDERDNALCDDLRNPFTKAYPFAPFLAIKSGNCAIGTAKIHCEGEVGVEGYEGGGEESSTALS